MNQTETCSCGASVAVSARWWTEVRDALAAFREAHAACRKPAAPTWPTPLTTVPWDPNYVTSTTTEVRAMEPTPQETR